MVGSLVSSLNPRAFGKVLATQKPGRIIILASAENHSQTGNTRPPQENQTNCRPQTSAWAVCLNRDLTAETGDRSGSFHRTGEWAPVSSLSFHPRWHRCVLPSVPPRDSYVALPWWLPEPAYKKDAEVIDHPQPAPRHQCTGVSVQS